MKNGLIRIVYTTLISYMHHFEYYKQLVFLRLAAEDNETC